MGQNWNKAHDPSKNTHWINYPSIDSPIIDEELNRNEVSVDTIDDRVITLDTIKAEQSDLLLAFKDVSLNTSTGVITFTLFNNTTKTIDTLLEKIAINFDYDDDPTSAHYQNLVITLEDGTVKYIDMSALITQYEFVNSSTIAWTIGNNGSVSASVPDGSITEPKLQPNFLADCRAAKTGAEAAEANAIAKALVSEGYANGKQNGVPVTSESPYYHNNAEYFKDQASSIVGSKVDSFNGRTGVVTSQSGDYNQSQIGVPNTASVGQVPTVRNVGGSNVFVMETPQGVTRLQSLDMVGKTTTFNADGSISIVADDYSEDITFNANGTITDAVTINNVTTVKTIVFNGSTIDEILGAVKVPNMTNNNVPSGIVTGSSKWSDTYNYWKAFNDGNNAWASASNQLTDQWLDYEFASAVKVNSVIWENRKDSNEIMPPKNYKIQASNDGTNYVDLTPIITNSNSDKGAKHYVSFANDTAYTHYRFFAIDLLDTGSSARFIAIGKIQYYGQ